MLFVYSRDISIFKLRIKPHTYWGSWQNSRWVQNCDLPTKKGNCFRFNSGLANLILIVLIKVTGDLRILTIVQHVDHNLFSVCNTFSDCKTIFQRCSTKMVSKSTVSYNGPQISGFAKLNLKNIYCVGSFWLIGYGRIILNKIMFSVCISFLSKISQIEKNILQAGIAET